MKKNVFESMPIEELWSLHEQVTSTLVRRIAEEKAKLEERLRRLGYSGGAIGRAGSGAISPNRTRRPYPKVLPKYQNPRNPAERWSGRGKQPRWVRAVQRLAKDSLIA